MLVAITKTEALDFMVAERLVCLRRRIVKSSGNIWIENADMSSVFNV